MRCQLNWIFFCFAQRKSLGGPFPPFSLQIWLCYSHLEISIDFVKMSHCRSYPLLSLLARLLFFWFLRLRLLEAIFIRNSDAGVRGRECNSSEPILNRITEHQIKSHSFQIFMKNIDMRRKICWNIKHDTKFSFSYLDVECRSGVSLSDR